MSYTCEVCNAHVKAGKRRLKHTIFRHAPERREVVARLTVVHPAQVEIARELAVCASCHAALKDGVPLQDLFCSHPKGDAYSPREGTIQQPPKPLAPVIVGQPAKLFTK